MLRGDEVLCLETRNCELRRGIVRGDEELCV